MVKHIRFWSILIALLLLALPLGACQSVSTGGDSGKLKGTIVVSGAWALYPMMTRWAEEFHQIYPEVEFDISAGGAGKGMADALAGAVDIGMVSRAVTAEEEAQGAYWVPVTKDAVFPTVSVQNPVYQDLFARGVPREIFVGIYVTGEIKTWGQVVGDPTVSDEIHVYTRSDAAGAPETWAKYLDGRQEDLLGVAVFGDPGLLEAVIKDPLGIGFNNLAYVYDMSSGEPVTGAAVLPIDQNANGRADPDEILETKAEAIEMVATGRYPSPPARDLNLVTDGPPSGLARAFIRWILTDGQQFVSEAGYVQFTEQQLQASLEKLE